jgi:3-dehydroquinate synthase
MNHIISLKFSQESCSYKIQIGNNFLNFISKSIKDNFCFSKAIILIDKNVKSLYYKLLSKAFLKKNIDTIFIDYPPYEGSKSTRVKEKIEGEMIKSGIGRNSLLIAFGGGVTGDLGGYIAATYMRGIPFIQIPTTLLAMVDSSIGGKVSINHPLGKNMIGLFYQPKAIFIDISMLNSLPFKEYTNGISEIIKTSLIKDKKLFSFINLKYKKIINKSKSELMEIIFKSCLIKSKIVMNDEKERGQRKLLNYGHSIGHAIELLSNFKISHGNAVSIGMNTENLIAHKIAMLSLSDLLQIKETLSLFQLPVNIPKNIKTKDILAKLKIDKKNIDGNFNFALLRKIGQGSINNIIHKDVIIEAIEEARY